MCKFHYKRKLTGADLTADLKSGRRVDQNGYVQVWLGKGHPSANKIGYAREHRVVMEGILGRPLLPGENVHHRNGKRDDNRPENLELWVTSQPSGQRPEDLVVWAWQIIARYDKGQRRSQSRRASGGETVPLF